MELNQPFKILSIDGGGLRGLTAVKILSEIQQISGRSIVDSFDLFAGTSTGGLIVTALTIKDKDGKSKYNLSDIESIYTDYGKVIFPCSTKVRKAFNYSKNIFLPRFSERGIDSVLIKFLEETRLSDCCKPLLITSFDLERYTPIIFTTRSIHRLSNGYIKNPNANAKLLDICKATSAAPVYLPSHHFIYADHGGKDYQTNCIDGGVYMNNPALSAYFEVVNNLNDPLYAKDNILKTEDIHILSIGTGKIQKSIDRKKTKKWGKYQWAIPVVDVMMDANSQTIDSQLDNLLGYKYFRINPDIDEKFSNMIDHRPKTSQHLSDKVNDLFRNSHFTRQLTTFALIAKL
ncbi:MAG: patatin-like phospholipase family protein [Phycisphaerales bacterium]|nr:patatin-like phospholipase family protein [Phycisphaerales bacterium]